MSTVIRRCKWCKQEFAARSADVKRGWAKFCSKSCKASEQENRTGQHAAHLRKGSQGISFQHVHFGPSAEGWDGHKY